MRVERRGLTQVNTTVRLVDGGSAGEGRSDLRIVEQNDEMVRLRELLAPERRRHQARSAGDDQRLRAQAVTAHVRCLLWQLESAELSLNAWKGLQP